MDGTVLCLLTAEVTKNGILISGENTDMKTAVYVFMFLNV
jgi:hypothetical protein